MPRGKQRVGVVGGGLAGLAAARRLAARGDLEVVVWEGASRPGGVLATSRQGGFVREHAANGILTGPPDGGAALAEELGLAVEPAAPAARRRWIVRRGALHAVPGELVQLVGWRALASALGEPFRPARRDAEDESVAAFARRRLGGEIAEALIAPLCTGVYAGDAEQLSLRAAFPRLAELEAEGGLFRASAVRAIRGLLADEKKPRSRIAAPAGGMQALVDALAGELGDRLVLDTPVVAIEVDGRARAVRLADGRREACDAVVVAVPAPAAARLLSDASRDLAATLDRIPYAPVAVVHLGYRREDIGHPMDGFGFLVAPGEELRLLGAVFESVLWPDRAPAGHVLVRCMFGGARDPGVLELTDDRLIERAHQDLARVLGVSGAPVHRHLVRWPRAIAQYTVGHQARVARAEELAEPLGVVLAGAAYRGVSVNACAADAARVVHRVATRLGLPLALALALACACSSGNKSGATSAQPGDAGGDKRPTPVATVPAEGGGGGLEIAVEWLDPPAELLASPGRNKCGAPLRPALAVTALGGVQGAVVTLEGLNRPLATEAAPVELAVKGCQVSPRALVAGRGMVHLVNDDERRQQVSFAAVGEEAGPLATVPLAVIGQTVAIPIARPGLVMASTATDPAAAAVVVVPEHADVAVTDESGKVRFDKVPPGTYAIAVWHPPVAKGGAPLATRAEVTVAGGAAATATISIAPAAK